MSGPGPLAQAPWGIITTAMTQLLTPDEVAKRLALSVKTLAGWRTRRCGPAYVKVGSLVRYREDALGVWIEERTKLPEPRLAQGTAMPSLAWAQRPELNDNPRLRGYRTQAMIRSEKEARERATPAGNIPRETTGKLESEG